MFDAVNGSCSECFRVIGPRSGVHSESCTKMPTLRDMIVSSSRKFLKPNGFSMIRLERSARAF